MRLIGGILTLGLPSVRYAAIAALLHEYAR
jgi:hypothetical protein